MMRIKYHSKDREPIEKYNKDDVIKWMKTFLEENGVNESHVDKYIFHPADGYNIAKIIFKNVANRNYSKAYGALLLLLSTAEKSYLSHKSDGSIIIEQQSIPDYNEVCKELVHLLKDNLKFNIE